MVETPKSYNAGHGLLLLHVNYGAFFLYNLFFMISLEDVGSQPFLALLLLSR